MLGQVQPGTVLTWNEPTFQFKEPSIGVMVVGTIEGTGVICLFALIAGLAFGGLRLVVKRRLPIAAVGPSSGIRFIAQQPFPVVACDASTTPGAAGRPATTADGS